MRIRRSRPSLLFGLFDYLIPLMIVLTLCVVSVKEASAENLTVSCNAPTQNTDGSAIASGAAITFNVYGGMQGTSPLPLLTPTPIATCSRTATNVNVGVVCYAVTAVETINALSTESAQTTPICTTVAPPTPASPTGTTVTVSVPTAANTIYILTKAKNQIVMIPAGTVPAGTQCDPSQSTTVNGNTFNLVPQPAPTTVTWTGTVQSLTAFAKCS